jgi:hypothetical protein
MPRNSTASSDHSCSQLQSPKSSSNMIADCGFGGKEGESFISRPTCTVINLQGVCGIQERKSLCYDFRDAVAMQVCRKCMKVPHSTPIPNAVPPVSKASQHKLRSVLTLTQTHILRVLTDMTSQKLRKQLRTGTLYFEGPFPSSSLFRCTRRSLSLLELPTTVGLLSPSYIGS